MIYTIVRIILSILVFILASGILIVIGLFYDHRRKPELALKYILGFIVFVGFGLLLVFSYHIYVIILAPLLIWGYFFFMFWDSKVRNKKKDKTESTILDN